MKPLPRAKPEYRKLTSSDMKGILDAEDEDSERLLKEINRLVGLYRAYIFARRHSAGDQGRPVAHLFRGLSRKRGLADIELAALRLLQREMTGERWPGPDKMDEET